MQSYLGHIQFNVRPGNLAFYHDLLDFLGGRTIYADEGYLGVEVSGRSSLWFAGQVKEVPTDYDGPGMNHLGIGVEAPADVDRTVDYLRAHGVAPLFDTPRHRPDFAASETDTYYQVMFESPDHILFEVVYIGPKDGASGVGDQESGTPASG